MNGRVEVLLFMAVLFCGTVGANAEAETCDAQRTWELMIRAKGGRERFEQLRSFFFVGTHSFGVLGRSRVERRQLYVSPDFFWSWDDPGTALFPKSVTIVRSFHGPVESSSEGHGRPDVYREGALAVAYESLMLYIPGVAPLKPAFRSCRNDEGGHTILTAVMGAATYDYDFPEDTFLPSTVTVHVTGGVITHILLDYVEIDGIMLPTRHIEQSEGLVPLRLRLRYEINPEYDAAIKAAKPSVEAGPDAWRPVGKRGHRRRRVEAPAVGTAIRRLSYDAEEQRRFQLSTLAKRDAPER